MTISFCFCGLATLLLLLICGLIDTRKQCQEQPSWRRQKLQLQQQQQQQQLTIVFSVVVSWHSFSTSFSHTHTHTVWPCACLSVCLPVCMSCCQSRTHIQSISNVTHRLQLVFNQTCWAHAAYGQCHLTHTPNEAVCEYLCVSLA